MDMIYDELNRVLDSAGVPRIVRERCPNPRCINGEVEVRHIGSCQVSVQRCMTCHGLGAISVEAA